MKSGLCKEESLFVAAKPVWLADLELEKNVTAGFRTKFERRSGNTVFKVAAASLYRFYVNGKFSGHGPARGPHGYFRVDEWDITDKVIDGINILAVEVVGYNINSYYLLNQPSFLQTEILTDGLVQAATGDERYGFEARRLTERAQKVHRYSFQRTFAESYTLEPGFDSWRCEFPESFIESNLEMTDTKYLIRRNVPIPGFDMVSPHLIVSSGNVEIENTYKDYSDLWSIGFVSDNGVWKGFDNDKVETSLVHELGITATAECTDVNETYDSHKPLKFIEKSFITLDFGVNLTGFIGGTITCHKDTKLFFIFDETKKGNDIEFLRGSGINTVRYEMSPGVYKIETIEPYTMKYLKILVLNGLCDVEDIYIREYANPDVNKADFKCSDDRLNTIFEAGRQTFRQNAVDIFMDCPSRERAGWLCDSYFMARTEFNLTGKSVVERNFLENYLLPEKFYHIPDGMLPMCYPADHSFGEFIPNWTLWFVLQLEEYLARTGDREMVDALKPKVLKIFDYFRFFIREHGLLEDLRGWIFVEWSRAGEFLQNVNFPTNMLFAAALESAGRMYGIDKMIGQAESIKETIRELSYNGEFFVDNAVRRNGKLLVTDNTSEVCQYYAFYFKVATHESHPELWKVLVDKFGPKRKNTGEYPDVHMANAFIGNYLRLELLSEKSLIEKLLEESTEFFLYMAERTGTLWEDMNDDKSCNHGFASHIVHCYYRDVLGIYNIDTVNKVATIRFCKTGLKWCKGSIPVNGSEVSLEWTSDADTIKYRLKAPADFDLRIENLSGKKLLKVEL